MANMHWAGISGTTAEIYERQVVPAIFAPWAEEVLARVSLRPGDRVLDVACGTGVVGRQAAARVGAAGRVVGLDVAPGMLTMARTAAPEASVEWREGSAVAMPLPDAAFDVVVCQQGLQYFPDRAAAVGEMHRVLATPGRLALAVFFSSAGHSAIAPVLAGRFGAGAVERILEPLSFPSATELAALVAGAGFTEVAVIDVLKLAHFRTPDAFVAYMIASRFGEPAGRLDQESLQALVADANDALAPWIGPDGLKFPMQSHLLTARK